MRIRHRPRISLVGIDRSFMKRWSITFINDLKHLGAKLDRRRIKKMPHN
jgi:hypothetical protein